MNKDIKKDIKLFLKYQIMLFCSMLYLELVLRLMTVGDFNVDNLWFIIFLPAVTMFFAVFTGIVGEKKGKLVTPLIIGIITFFYFSQLVYYKIFNCFWSVSMLGMAGTATKNFGSILAPTIFANLHLELLLLLPLAAAIYLGVREKVKYEKYCLPVHILAAVLFLPTWMLGVFFIVEAGNEKNSAYYVYASEFANTDMTIEKYGVFSTFLIEMGMSRLNYGAPKGDEIIPVEIDGDNNPLFVQPATSRNEKWVLDIDFDAIAEATDEEEIKQLCNYFASLEPSEKNRYTGYFEGYNLIYICAESFWTYAISKEFTPTLYEMANQGFILDNYYNSLPHTTCNGEFAFATGLWPDVGRTGVHNGSDTGSFAQSYKNYMPYGLGNLFNESGYTSMAFHNNIGSYYARNKSWPNLGYTCKFEETDDTPGMVFNEEHVNSDLDMMLQSVDDYINEDKFHAYYMTFSGHGPYSTDADNENIFKNLVEATEINKDFGFRLEALNYIAANMELDKAMEYLLQRLKEAGKLEKTVIVIASDHYPYFIKEQDTVNQLSGQELDMTIDKFKSTCIIYNAGMKEPVHVNTYCDNVDILPTILNLFNLEFDSRLLPGHDVFANNVIHKAMLGNYLGVNKSFITENVKYDGDSDTPFWQIDPSEHTEEELELYLDTMNQICMNEYKASLRLMDHDFFKLVYDQLKGEEEPEPTENPDERENERN